MIEARRQQFHFGEGLIAEEISDLREEWMTHADKVLDDEQLISTVYEALAKRSPKSRTRGRRGTPAEVVMRLLLLKHSRNWSFDVVEREVRSNLVYRDFTRVGAGKVPDSKTMGRWELALGPETVEKIHERVVEIAKANQLVQGRKMRLDTTVVETNIHYPTDSNLLGDGVRVLIRGMKRISELAVQQGAKLRDRSRSVKFRILEIGRIARTKGGPNRERLQQAYGKLLSTVGRVVGQAKRFSSEIVGGVKRSAEVMQQAVLEGLRKELDTFVPRVQQVMRQAKQRIFGGNTHVVEKLVSIFEPTTEIIRKGKVSKPTEFGKMVKIQEGENQIITDYEVYEKRPSDSELVIAAIDAHEKALGRTPGLMAADAAFYSAKNEAAAHDRGVKRVCIPNRSTKSAERKREQKKRWFKQGQKWRTGCEGRISVLKRRHGLRRCFYRGDSGMKRWVGLGVIADNLHHIGAAMAQKK
ncbi:MAG TPA: ISNCY family transposase [Candidatus Acidoferrales bacterium]|nr:ISNCY family transposase [Candidatus Acidoferrales bacterium]